MSEFDNFLPRPTMEGFLRGVDLRSLKGMTEQEIKDAINSLVSFSVYRFLHLYKTCQTLSLVAQCL